MFNRAITIIFLFLAISLPAAALATSVQTGIDPVEHIPPSWWDFGPMPLPADFFGPGSDPFDGGIPGDQTSIWPSPDCPGDLGNTSMLIERHTIANLPGFPSSDIIDTEIIAMSLVSASPITVTYNGGLNPEQWNVEIALSPSLASLGTMLIRQEHANGGTFDAEIYLQPYFTFTRVSDSQVVTLDGAGTYEDLISAINIPWVYSDPDLACPSCVTNFLPGHNGNQLVDYTYFGTSSMHTVHSGCAQNPIPTLSQWGLAIVLTLLLLAGGYLIVRRRRIAGVNVS
jgi:hypothetical protein